MAFFPLFIVGLYEVLFGDAKCWRMLALSACGIFLSHMLSTMLCAVLAAGAALLCLRRVIGQKRFVPLAKAAGLCLLLGLFQLAPFCMYSMQGIGAGTLVNDLTVNAVEPGQILMMGAGSASGSSANQKVLAFSVEIGLPLLIGAMLALYAALQKPERGENEKAVLRLLACGAALAVAATDFFPWGPVSTLTGGKVGYMQFTWRLLMFVAPLLALAGGYGVTELGGKRRTRRRPLRCAWRRSASCRRSPANCMGLDTLNRARLSARIWDWLMRNTPCRIRIFLKRATVRFISRAVSRLRIMPSGERRSPRRWRRRRRERFLSRCWITTAIGRR